MGKAPSGILKVFLVLPEGEKNFIRTPVGDLKSFIACLPYVAGRKSGPMRGSALHFGLDIQEGLRKFNFFARCTFEIAVLEPLGPVGC